MKSTYKLSGRYEKQQKRIKRELIAALAATVCLAAIVVGVGLKNLKEESMYYANAVREDYFNLVKSYIHVFDTVYDRIVEKIEENPSFEEMDAWLKSKDKSFAQSMGSEVYDGIAITYKGGYAHSWDYGNYEDYDASQRPWYQTAKEANGETAVVPPYVTFLDSQYLADGTHILMSIVKKYNDEIYFDYDIKLNEVKKMLLNERQIYPNVQILMFDKDGYILSSSDESKFSHNVNVTDDAISKSLSASIAAASNKQDKIMLRMVNGHIMLIYMDTDYTSTSVCVQMPFWYIVQRNFLAIMLAMLLLFLIEFYIYKRSEKRLCEYNSRDEQLSAITNAAFIGCLYVDTETMLFSGSARAQSLFPSRSYVELFNHMIEKVNDVHEKENVSKHLSPQAMREDNSDFNRLESWSIGINRMQSDGTKKHVTIEISRLYSLLNGKKTACLLTRDISEDADILKSALVKAESASAAKSEFLSRVSHDIRTPLNVIIGMAHLAEENDNPEDTDECLKNIDVSGEFLLGLINDVLDLERIESGKIQLNPTPYSAKEFKQYITSVIQPLCEQKCIHFNYKMDSPCEFVIVQDKLRINQIYFNLLSNAVKFTPDGGTIDFCTTATVDKDKIILDVLISDNGIGMSKEFQAQMFDSFTQESREISPDSNGNGLGLAIVKQLCDLMGMTISVTSSLGHGTSFKLHGEYLKADEALQKDNSSKSTSKVNRIHGKTVLVCEDHPLNQQIVKRLLDKMGVMCIMAEDGKRGVDIFQKSAVGSIAAILMDIRMPVMDGLQAARAIRAIDREDAKSIPIIALSANAYDEDVKKCIEAGMNAHLPKPIDPKLLFDVLSEQIDEN